MTWFCGPQFMHSTHTVGRVLHQMLPRGMWVLGPARCSHCGGRRLCTQERAGPFPLLYSTNLSMKCVQCLNMVLAAGDAALEHSFAFIREICAALSPSFLVVLHFSLYWEWAKFPGWKCFLKACPLSGLCSVSSSSPMLDNRYCLEPLKASEMGKQWKQCQTLFFGLQNHCRWWLQPWN